MSGLTPSKPSLEFSGTKQVKSNWIGRILRVRGPTMTRIVVQEAYIWIARGGRPRKYEKGKEPYLAAKRRAEARRIIAERATGSVEPDNADLDGVTRARSLSIETEGGALVREPPPKRARIEELLNQEDLELPTPPKRRGRPPGVKNGEGKKRQAAKRREKRPRVMPKESTKKSGVTREPQELKGQDPQLDLTGAEPGRDLQENPGSLGKRKAQTAGGKTGRAKRRKETVEEVLQKTTE